MKTNKIIVLIILIFFAITLVCYFKYDSFAYGGYERSMLKFSVDLFKTTQESYKEQFKVYDINKDNIIHSFTLPEEVKIYVDVEDVPIEIRNKISLDEKPYIAENDYSVIITIDSKKFNKLSIWKFDSTSEPKKIY